MCLEKRETVMEAYMISQFGYCSLVWTTSSFEDLLEKDNSVSIHHRNIQVLATEISKVKNNIAPEIIKELFAPKMSPYAFVITIRLREGE